MKYIAVIPARYESTRLPGKPLKDICGMTMIHRVYEAVDNTRLFDEVIVATDDQRIMNEVESFAGNCRMTSTDCQSGTDRVYEASKDMDCDVIVNVQGDEPFIDKNTLAKLLEAFNDSEVKVASLMTKIINESDYSNPNCVKVVCDTLGDAMYFSRSPLPYARDENKFDFYRHIGVYAFQKEILAKFVELPQSDLEQVEKLEQLRLLENGYSIRMVQTDYQGIGIDTEEDLDKAINNIKTES